MTPAERRWLIVFGMILAVQMVFAAGLILTVLLGFIGWPWMWLSFSTFRSVRAFVDRGDRPSALAAGQCWGVVVAMTLLLCATLRARDGLDASEQITWLLTPPLLVLYVKAGLILTRYGRTPSEQRGDLGPAGVLG